jgi:hypothetical protein
MANSERWLDRAAHALLVRNYLVLEHGSDPASKVVEDYEERAANALSRAKRA